MQQEQNLKKTIRSSLRKKRKSLNLAEIRFKSLSLMRNLIKDPQYIRSKKIAVYSAHEGEIDPHFILEDAWQKHKHCYLPVLHPIQHNYLIFVESKPSDILKRNRYGILEPKLQSDRTVPTDALDLVLLPMVAFDLKGTRLGSGKGYYDRTFAFIKQKHSHLRKMPLLLGLAYDFQQVEELPVQTFDVPLSGVLTEERLIWFNKKESA